MNAANDADTELLKFPDAAAFVKFTESKFRKAIVRPESRLEPIKIGGRYYFTRPMLRQWVAGLELKAVGVKRGTTLPEGRIRGRIIQTPEDWKLLRKEVRSR